MWDGENAGGKVLMKLREQYKLGHSWMGPNEQQVSLFTYTWSVQSIRTYNKRVIGCLQETEKKYRELKNTAWRRQMNDRSGGRFGGDRFGGGRGGGGMGMRRGIGPGLLCFA